MGRRPHDYSGVTDRGFWWETAVTLHSTTIIQKSKFYNVCHVSTTIILDIYQFRLEAFVANHQQDWLLFFRRYLQS